MGKKVRQKNDRLIEKLNKQCETVILLFTLILLGVFPLYYRNYYYDILDAKLAFYKYTVFITFAIVLAFRVIILYYKKKFGKTRAWSMKTLYQSLNIPDQALLWFLMIAAISTLLSEYQYEAFWGDEGRKTGLYLLSIYGLSFFIISKGLKFKSWILDVCLVSGLLACLFGITDYFQMDFLHFKENIKSTQFNIFTSTFGNINTYTAYVGMIMGLAATLFTTAKKVVHRCWYYICMIISFFAIIMGVSDNAYLALAALFAFLPLYLFRKRSGIRNYFLMLASFFSVVQCIDWINQFYEGRVVTLDGLFQTIVGYNYLEYIVIALWIIVAVLYLLAYKTKNKEDIIGNQLCFVWLAVLSVAIIVVIYVVIDANFGNHANKYGALSNYLALNDEWGTHRGYIWRIGVENYRKFPLMQKIFGYGPDTFGIITKNNNYYEMTRRYAETFDSTHNEYLQYFITIGPLGLAAYLWLLISSGIRMIKKGSKNPYVIAILFALICYSVQAVVNINLPIATPIMWTLLMVGLAACRPD